MTVLDTTITTVRFQPVLVDLYRAVHKGIRSELFALVTDAGRLDPADEFGIVAYSEQMRSVARLLEHHARTEDQHVGPVLEEFAPWLAEKIATDHESFEIRFPSLTVLADEVRGAADHREALHEVYIEVASFTSTYLAHQDLEERVINPTLQAAVGDDGMRQIQGQIIGTMDPRELIAALAVMLPAMNVDERSELLGGMQAHAPAEAFGGVWSLAGSVLTAADYQAVARRLGLR